MLQSIVYNELKSHTHTHTEGKTYEEAHWIILIIKKDLRKHTQKLTNSLLAYPPQGHMFESHGGQNIPNLGTTGRFVPPLIPGRLEGLPGC